MTDCTCHAGKICEIHVEEVMGNLNKYGGSVRGGIVGGHLGSPTPEEIDHDIIGELVKLRQKVADLEDNKNFYEGIATDIGKRLNDAEDKLRLMDRILGGLELQRLRGNG